MAVSAVVAAVGAAATYVGHKDAKSAMAAQQQAMSQQQAQGETALTQQQAALDQQKDASAAALAEQKAADQARVDQANTALTEQKNEFDTTFAASQATASAQLQAQRDAGALQLDMQSKAAAAQQQAMQAQMAAADRLYTQQSEQVNRANQKQPDTAAITAGNVQSAKSGQSGTMLTGPAGIDLNSLLLGKNTLLGG